MADRIKETTQVAIFDAKGRSQAFRERGTTREAVAAEIGAPYSELCRMIRNGDVGAAGTKSRRYAERVAEILRIPFAQYWGAA